MAEQANKEPTMEEILSTIRRIISEDGDVPPAPGAPEPAPATVLDAVQEAVSPSSDFDEDVARQDADDFFDALEDLDDSIEFGTSQEQTEETSLSLDDFAQLDDSSEDDLRFEDLLDDGPGLEEDLSLNSSPFATEPVFDSPAETVEDAAEAFADDFDQIAALDEPAEFVSTEEIAAKPEPVVETVPEPVLPPVAEETPPMPAPQAVTELDTPLMAPESASAAASSLAKLISNVDMTSDHNLDSMVRQMLQPMIKAWLDENLPEIVERKVQAEVERIANMVR